MLFASCAAAFDSEKAGAGPVSSSGLCLQVRSQKRWELGVHRWHGFDWACRDDSGRLCVDVWLESRTFVERLDSFLQMATGSGVRSHDSLLRNSHIAKSCDSKQCRSTARKRESAPKFMLQPVAATAPRYAIGCPREVRQDVLARRAVPWLREELDDSRLRRLDPGKGRKSKKGKGKGRGRSAEAILKALFDLGPHPPQAAVFSACWPGLASWERNPKAATAVLAGLGRRGLWDVALKVTRFMQHHSLDINCFHYTSVISACERRGKWEIALTLLSSMKEEEVLPSEVTYNAAISACAKGGEWSVALQLLKEMRLDDVMPDCVSYNAASSACASAGLWNSSLHLLQEMCTSTVPPSVVTFSTLLSACEKGKQWQMAINTLFHPPVPALMPDKICFTAVISACEKAKEWEKALLCFRHMDTRDLPKDDICFHTVISSCIRARAWSQALSLALEMEALPLAVNGILWGGVATAMQQSGQPIAQLSSRLRRKWARQQSSHSSGLLALPGIGESREHEVHVLDQAEGLLAAFKPTGLSTEAALQRILHLLTKEGYTGHLSRASRLDGRGLAPERMTAPCSLLTWKSLMACCGLLCRCHLRGHPSGFG